MPCRTPIIASPFDSPHHDVNLLALDTSTEQLSVALAWQAQGQVRQRVHEAPGGAQASRTLLAAVQQLMDEAGLAFSALDAIAFGRGPGAFTGLRTACAVAQGLGFGAGRPLLPVETTLLVAQAAWQTTGATRVVAVLDARMGEVYTARYVHAAHDGLPHWQRDGEITLGAPASVQVPPGWLLAGNALQAVGAGLAQAVPQLACLPGAAALLALAPALLAAGRSVPADQAMPLYIRDKVAQTSAERAAARAAAVPTP